MEELGPKQLLDYCLPSVPSLFTCNIEQTLLAVQDWLTSIGCDLSGLLLSELPTPRAWQILENDGRRTEVLTLCLIAEANMSIRKPAYCEIYHIICQNPSIKWYTRMLLL